MALNQQVKVKRVAPFKFANVGSFLRPAKLKAAREAFEEGSITQSELKNVEDITTNDIDNVHYDKKN